MTFSIAARCAKTGMLGIAVSSSSPAVAARCAFARAGVGAAASQNITDPALGQRLLDLMQTGRSARAAVDEVVGATEHIQFRQLTAVDAHGGSAAFSGGKTLGVHATVEEENVVCAGNLLGAAEVPTAMAEAFRHTQGHLAERLLAVMRAAVAAGGEAGPVHSAGLLIVDKVSWPVADLRVDWEPGGDPIGALAEVWAVYAPQLDDYVTRALNPAAAPSYGVPGDR